MMCIPLNNIDTNLKYIITVCYNVIILYSFLPMHSFFFPLVYKLIVPKRQNKMIKMAVRQRKVVCVVGGGGGGQAGVGVGRGELWGRVGEGEGRGLMRRQMQRY